jgi:hypothetical protein
MEGALAVDMVHLQGVMSFFANEEGLLAGVHSYV